MSALALIEREVVGINDDDDHNAAILLNLQRSGVLTPAGLQLANLTDDPGEVPLELLEALGRALGEVRDMTAWALGDLILFTEAVHGELYAQLVEATGRSKSTLQNYVRVCTRLPYSRRRVKPLVDVGLSWSHHEAVATLEPDVQDRLLDKAIAERLDVELLRDEVRAARGIGQGEQQVIDDVDRVDVITAAKSVVSKARRVEGGYLIGVRAYESLRDAVDRDGGD